MVLIESTADIARMSYIRAVLTAEDIEFFLNDRNAGVGNAFDIFVGADVAARAREAISCREEASDALEASVDARRHAAALNYQPVWAKLKRRKLLVWCIYGIFLPLVGGSALVARFLARNFTEISAFIAFVAWMIIWSTCLNRLANLECPRCGYLFFGRGIRRNIFRSRCTQCDLQSGA